MAETSAALYPDLPITMRRSKKHHLKGVSGGCKLDAHASVIRTLAGHGLLEPVGTGRFQMHWLLVRHARSLPEQ